MYINKKLYYFFKTIVTIGLWLWSFVGTLIVAGFLLELLAGNFGFFLKTEILSMCMVLLTIWPLHIFANKWLNQANVYDRFFANDPDGVLLVHVLAKALGLREQNVIAELRFFSKLRLFQLTIEQNGGYAMVTVHRKETEHLKMALVCPNCGALNHVRKGYVQTCGYCLCALDEEVAEHVSES